jgi:hypothetical protein
MPALAIADTAFMVTLWRDRSATAKERTMNAVAANTHNRMEFNRGDATACAK